MNILQINKYYFDKGGAERYMFELSDALKMRGHSVTPFAMERDENLRHPMEKYFVSPVVTERPQINAKGFKTFWRFVWSREAGVMMKKLIEASNAEIAHCHNIYHQLSPSILPVLKKKEIPVVMTLHDFHLVSPAYNLYAHGGRCEHAKGSKFFKAVKYRCVKDSYAASALCACELWLHRKLKVYERNIDCFIAPSRFLADTIREWGFAPKRMEIIPNFVQQETPRQFPAAPRVLYAGRLSAEKGISTLLEIISLLPDIQFTIAGIGPMEQEVKKFAEAHKNVRFLGYIMPRNMPAIFAECSVLIVPSHAPEVFPMIILEAFASGRPVVASRAGGIPEMVMQGETGELLEVGSAEKFAHAITTLISKPIELARRGNNAYQLVKKKYSPDAHYHAIMQIYTSLLTSHL